MQKYIIRRWTKNFREERASSFIEAVKVWMALKNDEPGYCHIIKISFKKRHPDFPLWFSLLTLLIVGFL